MAADPTQALRTFVDSIAHIIRMLLVKPARDMSGQEASNVFMTLVHEKKILLHDPIELDRGGNIRSPKPGQQVRVKTSMAGVQFLKALGENRGVVGSVGASVVPFF